MLHIPLLVRKSEAGSIFGMHAANAQLVGGFSGNFTQTTRIHQYKDGRAGEEITAAN